MIKVRFAKIHPLAQAPEYMTPGSSGCDVTACLEAPLVVAPLSRVAVPTGLVVEIPIGWEIQVRPRSGLSFKTGLTVVNAPGTIDSDFRGEVKILMVNLGANPVRVTPGERIAQWVLQKVERIEWDCCDSVEDLEVSERGVGGFGSTGRGSHAAKVPCPQ